MGWSKGSSWGTHFENHWLGHAHPAEVPEVGLQRPLLILLRTMGGAPSCFEGIPFYTFKYLQYNQCAAEHIKSLWSEMSVVPDGENSGRWAQLPAFVGLEGSRKRKWSRWVVSNSATPWSSLPCSSIHGIFQTRVLEWVAIPFSRIFPTQGSNPGLLHCRQMLYHLSHQGRALEHLNSRFLVV